MMLKKIIRRFDTPIHHEQIRALYQQSPFLFLGILGVMAIVVVFFWERADHQLLLLWLAANLLLTFSRAVLVVLFRRVQPQGQVLVKWGLVFVVSATISGALWGMIAVLFMNPDDVMSVLLVVLVLTGMSSGSQLALSTFLPAFFGFGLPALLPLAAVLIYQPEGVFTLIGYLTIVFIAVNMGFSFIINRNVSESIRLRFENLHLLEGLRQQKNLAEKANADKSRFLAATSHDLRQPLHAMDLYLGALKNLLTSDEQTELLSKGQQSSAALSGLLTALMDISRLDSGDVVVDKKVFNVTALMQSICDEYKVPASQQNIKLQVQAPVFWVDSDPVMLGRILRNLVNNACTHSDAKNIFLKAEKIKDQVLVSVCDDGKGIPQAQQQHVFSEFYQLNNPERDRDKGLGLGLAIVKRMSSLLQHDLQLESVEGEGSCFKLCLPLAEGELSPATSISNSQEKDISGLFIILVDDEAEIRNAMRVLLLQWGCELLVADDLQSLQQELAKLKYPKPDVLLCDYRLRENQTGLGVVDAMRKYFDAELPALIISGDTDKAIEQKVLNRGCVILHKPVQPKTLQEAIYTIACSGIADT